MKKIDRFELLMTRYMKSDNHLFLRKVMVYITISEKCHRCSQISYPGLATVNKLKFNHLILDPILELPICAACKVKMPMISETSAVKKYKI